MKRILVPIDGTRVSEHVLDRAFDMAKKEGATIVALSSINVSYSTGVNWKEIYEIVKGKKAEPLLAKVAERGRKEGVPVEPLIKRGPIHETIIEASREMEVDMVIMGVEQRRSKAPIKKHVSAVLSRICCPVLTVKNCKYEKGGVLNV
jgi:nucleotide-binding universal stress UspA family protein